MFTRRIFLRPLPCSTVCFPNFEERKSRTDRQFTCRMIKIYHAKPNVCIQYKSPDGIFLGALLQKTERCIHTSLFLVWSETSLHNLFLFMFQSISRSSARSFCNGRETRTGNEWMSPSRRIASTEQLEL